MPSVLPPANQAILPSTAIPSEYSEEHAGPNPYSAAAINTKYEYHSGLIQVESAAPVNTPTQAIRRSSGRWTKTVSWTVERLGAPPRLPDDTPINSNEVLHYVSIIPAAPPSNPDGTRIFRVSGIYIYICLQKPTEFHAGRLPYDLRPATLNQINPAQFDSTLLQ